VVKELVENSLDAGATSIGMKYSVIFPLSFTCWLHELTLRWYTEVRFKNDGLDSIEVQDNGGGIAPENYESIGMTCKNPTEGNDLPNETHVLSALKHYTSKLSSYDDLTFLTTFGFRGEALSSLCAVSNFHIITAQAHQAPKANKLEFEHSGKLKGTQIVAGQKGTIVSVANLFSKLPVRRKELEKNIKRELAKVINLLNEYACITTGVRFNVKNTDAKRRQIVLLTTKANSTVKDNIANVYGAKTLLTLIPLALELEFEPSATGKRLNRELNKIHVKGYISRPVVGEGRGTRDRQMYYVNSRPCGIPQIAKAFNEVYKSYNISQAPFVLADFQMDTGAYDVNVSPDKRTILLHDSAALINSLKEALDKSFEEAEQTVPQSQFTSNKQQSNIQQRLQQSLMRGIPAKEGIEQSIPVRNESRRGQTEAPLEHASEDKPEEEEVTEKETPIAVEQADSQVASTEPGANVVDVDEDAGHADDAVNRIRAQAAQLSPQPNERQIPKLQSRSPVERTSIIQNAFDRMRPRRPPAEVATITIGDKVTTSVVGQGSLRKRDSSSAGYTEGTGQSKRRIHTPSKSNIFSQNLKSFAAPGTQHDANGADSQEDLDEAEGGSDEDEEMSETTQSPIHSPDAPVDTAESIEDSEVSEDEQGDILPSDVPVVDGADGDVIEETEKKAQEDAKVQELIRKAEEKGALNSDNLIKRGKHIEKEQQSHKHSTTRLVATLNSAIARVQTQMETLQTLLGSYNKVKETKQDDEFFVQQQTGEERLSLTVTKDDFAKMRIAGQFNLGFILATRSHGANETTVNTEDELFIIDQHASDEKYNFERLQAETVVQNQRLVRPKTLDLTAVEEEIIRENKLSFEKNGFVIEVDDSGDEPIGRRCKLISLPLSKEVVFDVHDLEELIVLLSETPTNTAANTLKSDTYVPRPTKVRKMFAMRACRSSIMIGKTLTVKQMEKVVQNMGTIDKPWNCPHGRPTMRHLMSLGSWDEFNEYSVINEHISTVEEVRCPWQRFYDWQHQQDDENQEEGENEDEEEDREDTI
jgi:DNA mismatch repair protein PMS2